MEGWGDYTQADFIIEGKAGLIDPDGAAAAFSFFAHQFGVGGDSRGDVSTRSSGELNICSNISADPKYTETLRGCRATERPAPLRTRIAPESLCRY